MSRAVSVLVLTAVLLAQLASAQPNLDPKELDIQVAELFQPLVAQDLTSGTVLIAHGDEVLLNRGFGLSNRDHNIANSPETKFRLASTSKSLTAVAVMQLIERGLVELDAPLATYLPDYPRSQEISIRHLLTHSSGIPSTPAVDGFVEKSLSNHKLEESITWFQDEPLQFEPGREFDYSNSGYVLLSRVIEVASGLSYERYMKDHIFDPTGMTGSGLDSQDKIIAGRSTGYSRVSGGAVVRAAYRNPSECFGCGALFSSVGDLLKFQRAIVNSKLLEPKSRDAMWTPVFDTPWGDQYGLGWFVGELYGHKMVAARGGTTGFMSMVQYFLDEDILVVTLLNQDFMLHGELFDRIAAITLGEPWTPLLSVPSTTERDHPILEFVGRYRMDDGVIVSVSADDGGFFYEEEGQPQKFRIHPVDDHTGFVAEPNARLIFKSATEKEPAKLIGLHGVLLWQGERVSNVAHWPDVSGPYLGQDPPGMVPELFAPELISTDQSEIGSVFSPDHSEFYFTTWTREAGTKIMVVKQIDDAWAAPEPASFSNHPSDVDAALSADGTRIFFGTRRPRPGEAEERQDGFDIWYANRTDTGWGEEDFLGPIVNSGTSQVYPTVTSDGTLYFQAIREGGYGRADIYRSRLVDGVYQTPENLGPTINSRNYEGDVYVAPDESYMIISIYGREDDIGGGDLYVSFQDPSGVWSQPKNMGPGINSATRDFCPMVTPDGKYLFFSSKRLGVGDIFWVNADVIEELKVATN